MPMGMTAHIVFEDIDDSAPATTSRMMMDVIRNDIGFNGLLMTDDIGMEALSGDVAQRSRASIAAGCDVIFALLWRRVRDCASGRSGRADDGRGASPCRSRTCDAQNTCAR